MKVTIYSDIMCPFCYIGKKNFENALDQLPFKNEIDVEWKSFQLDPELQETSGKVSTVDYLMKRKGFTREQTLQMMTNVTQMGKSSGVVLDFEKTLVANTFQAHKLLQLAKEFGKSNELEELLFEAHFTKGQNVADPKILIGLASSLGIDTVVAEEALRSNEYESAVNRDIDQARAIGVSGVPFFVLDDKYGISGAQPSDVFVDALSQAFAESENMTDSAKDGMSCDADGCEI